MSRLEKITHFFLIAVCCASLAALGQGYLSRRDQASPRLVSATSTGGATHRIQVGERFALAGVDWSHSPTNVVIDIRSGCQYCEASLPFYQELTQAGRQHSAAVSVFAVSSDTAEVLNTFLTKAGVTVDRIIQANPGSLGIPGTPTVLLVDANGIIRERYLGKLGESQEKALLSRLNEPGSFPTVKAE